MKFIKVSGAVLLNIAQDAEVAELRDAGVMDDSTVRINEQGDIELLIDGQWSIIGGLLGDFEARIRRVTGLDWS